MQQHLQCYVCSYTERQKTPQFVRCMPADDQQPPDLVNKQEQNHGAAYQAELLSYYRKDKVIFRLRNVVLHNAVTESAPQNPTKSDCIERIPGLQGTVKIIIWIQPCKNSQCTEIRSGCMGLLNDINVIEIGTNSCRYDTYQNQNVDFFIWISNIEHERGDTCYDNRGTQVSGDPQNDHSRKSSWQNCRYNTAQFSQSAAHLNQHE